MRRFMILCAMIVMALGGAAQAQDNKAGLSTTVIGVRVFHDICMRSFLQTPTFRDYLKDKFMGAPEALAAKVKEALGASPETIVYVLTGANASYALALDPKKTACYLASPLPESYAEMKAEFANAEAQMAKAGFEVKDLGEAESKTAKTLKRNYALENLSWYVTGAVSKLPPASGRLMLTMGMVLQKPAE